MLLFRLTLPPLTTSMASTVSMPAAVTDTLPLLPASTPFSVSTPPDCSMIEPPTTLLALTVVSWAEAKSMMPPPVTSELAPPVAALSR